MENSNYISDRCIMDCFAVIKMRMTKEDLEAFNERHKVRWNLIELFCCCVGPRKILTFYYGMQVHFNNGKYFKMDVIIFN